METFFGLKAGERAENIKYKFRFAPKLPSICINQICSIEVDSYISYSHLLQRKPEEKGSGEGAPELGDFWDLISK